MFSRRLLLTVSLITLCVVPAFAQPTDRDAYLTLFRQGEFEKAAALLKQVTKKEGSNADAWYHYGMALAQTGREKDSVKAFQKAIALKPTDDIYHAGLAQAYMLAGDKNMETAARKSLELSKDANPQAHWVLGVWALRSGDYKTAHDEAARTLELQPNNVPALALESQALVSLYIEQRNAVPRSASTSAALLVQAADTLDKFVAMSQPGSVTDVYRQQAESIRFFADYYSDPNRRPVRPADPAVAGDPAFTPVKIIEKRPAPYTPSARANYISGTARLLVGFGPDGTVKHVIVTKPLDPGLDQNAVRAAREIKFEPAKRNGVPVPAVLTVEYNWQIR
jgi:TonB family protein